MKQALTGPFPSTVRQGPKAPAQSCRSGISRGSTLHQEVMACPPGRLNVTLAHDRSGRAAASPRTYCLCQGPIRPLSARHGPTRVSG